MLDLTKSVGSVNGQTVYMFQDCSRYCTAPNIGEVYVLDDDGSTFVSTPYVYFDGIRATHTMEVMSGAVLNKTKFSINGNYFTRRYEMGRPVDMINGVPYTITSLDGATADHERLKTDGDFQRFLGRYSNRERLELYLKAQRLSGSREETAFYIKYKQYFAIFYADWSELTYLGDEQEFGVEVASAEDRSAIESIYVRRKELYVDRTSLVDIVKEDQAFCFNEIVQTLYADVKDINYSDIGKRLNLAKDTIYIARDKAMESPDNPKATGKLFIYKAAYGFLKATLGNL